MKKLLLLFLLTASLFGCNEELLKSNVKNLIQQKNYNGLIELLERKKVPNDLQKEIYNFFANNAPAEECARFASKFNNKLTSAEKIKLTTKVFAEENASAAYDFLEDVGLPLELKKALKDLILSSKSLSPQLCTYCIILSNNFSFKQKEQLLMKIIRKKDISNAISCINTMYLTSLIPSEIKTSLFKTALKDGSLKECEELLSYQLRYKYSNDEEILLKDRILELTRASKNSPKP